MNCLAVEVVPETVSEMAAELRWREILAVLDFAFQPIVNAFTGECYGYEALLRNVAAAGFHSIRALFDAAWKEQMLYRLDLMLRARVLGKFASIPWAKDVRLFYNLDNRVLEMPDYSTGNTSRLLEEYGLSPESVCFEVSERHEFSCYTDTRRVLESYRRQGFRIALDDFGAGFSGLQLLYHTEPDLIKVDRFFIEGIATDARKRFFVTNIINMAHVLGILVVGEGVETEKEFLVCRDIGCDLVQGYYVQHPTVRVDELFRQNETVAALARIDRRRKQGDRDLISRHLTLLSPLSVDTTLKEVLRRFRDASGGHPLPIVNARQEPIGVIREQDLKTYVYSPYGFELLKHRTVGESLERLVSRCPLAEVHGSAARILQMFSVNRESDGILITDNGGYLGFLDARSLLAILNDKAVSEAQDQNPLTRLPGNTRITEFLFRESGEASLPLLVAYLDLDSFKPFNDAYGFRRGDRALLLFADILRNETANLEEGGLLAHIGGDDFFIGLPPGTAFPTGAALVGRCLARFADEVLSLYDLEDRTRGGVGGHGRDGEARLFPFLSASAALLVVPAGCTAGPDEIGKRIAILKSEAKRRAGSLAAASCWVPERTASAAGLPC